jgi:predicted flap endonuclease-1-like 5' DNA nuclease
VPDENVALQAWRLRYFEQRVKYLEEKAQGDPTMLATAGGHQDEMAGPPLEEWRAREAEARATFLEDALRARSMVGSVEAGLLAEDPESAPFAANADVDALLRWRLLYLERRVAHLQNSAEPRAELPPVVSPGSDPDRWKWRARYLEARVRHLEQRPAQTAVASLEQPEDHAATPVRVAAPSRRAKPPILPAARSGAPDDLTLIDGVSLLQQTTLYSLGVFHFDQIAAWSDEHVAWVDQYLRLQGRITDEEWLEQASELAAHGPAAARRAFESEDA